MDTKANNTWRMSLIIFVVIISILNVIHAMMSLQKLIAAEPVDMAASFGLAAVMCIATVGLRNEELHQQLRKKLSGEKENE